MAVFTLWKATLSATTCKRPQQSTLKCRGVNHFAVAGCAEILPSLQRDLSLIKCTEPSPNNESMPPECMLRADRISRVSVWLL